ncbi:MAG TPA: dihydrofolate reductase family protein [Thermoplasmata archaeon]|nr:dihydrofolate reductase family protein [Thermoplasmata archaeon]
MATSDNSARAVRPAVWVNCAASADGRLAFAHGTRAVLSSPEDLRRVQQLRANADAILVGVGTVIQDDPSLRVHWELLERPEGPAPTRVVVDSTGRTPDTARLLDRSAPTIVGTTTRSTRKFPDHVRTVVAGTLNVDLSELFVRLYQMGIRRLMVEGGADILASVLREGLFDRWTVYYAPAVIGGITAPPIVRGPESSGPDDWLRLELAGVERVGEGYVATYLPARRNASVKPERGSPAPENVP